MEPSGIYEMQSFNLGLVVHEDANVGVVMREAICTTPMGKLLVKQYSCTYSEEIDCLLKEALKQVSQEYPVCAILREVIFSKGDTRENSIVNFIYEKLQDRIPSNFFSKNDRTTPIAPGISRYQFKHKSYYLKKQVITAYDTETQTSVIVTEHGPFREIEETNRVIKQTLVQSTLTHSNWTKVLDIFVRSPERESFIIGIVMEQLSTDLQKDILERKAQHRPYTEQELLTFLLQITSALTFARSLRIAHRNINPGCVHISSEGVFKLGDFDTVWSARRSVKAQPNLPTWEKYLSDKAKGKPQYLSPEVRSSKLSEGQSIDFFACDVYSLGVTLLYMATLKEEDLVALDENTYQETIKRAIQKLPYSEDLKSIIREMLRDNWKQRSVAGKIFTEVVNLLETEQLQDPIIRQLAEVAAAEQELLLAEDSQYISGDLSNVVSSFFTLGNLYYDQGNLGKAKKCFSACLDIKEKLYPEYYPEFAMCYDSLGNIYKRSGDLKNAESYYMECLGILQQITANNHPDLAKCYNDLGSLYCDLGNIKEAEMYLLKSYFVLKEQNEHNSELAKCYNNLGLLHRLKGNFEKAEKMIMKSFSILKQIYSENHPEVGKCYSSLAHFHYAKGDLRETEECYLKCLEVMRKVFPSSHFEFACCYNILGNIYTQQERWGEAEQFFFEEP